VLEIRNILKALMLTSLPLFNDTKACCYF